MVLPSFRPFHIHLPTRLRSTLITRFNATMRALTSRTALAAAGTSQLHTHMLPDILPSTTPCTRAADSPPFRHPGTLPMLRFPCGKSLFHMGMGFAVFLAARQYIRPNHVRHYPAGCPFPFRCSPPRLAADAVTVGYKPERFSLSRTFTSLHVCAHWRTKSGVKPPALLKRRGASVQSRRRRRRDGIPIYLRIF